jgi:hypothetical protein
MRNAKESAKAGHHEYRKAQTLNFREHPVIGFIPEQKKANSGIAPPYKFPRISHHHHLQKGVRQKSDPHRP